MELQTGGSIEKTVATVAEEGRDLSAFVLFFFAGLLKSETIRFFFFREIDLENILGLFSTKNGLKEHLVRAKKMHFQIF